MTTITPAVAGDVMPAETRDYCSPRMLGIGATWGVRWLVAGAAPTAAWVADVASGDWLDDVDPVIVDVAHTMVAEVPRLTVAPAAWEATDLDGAGGLVWWVADSDAPDAVGRIVRIVTFDTALSTGGPEDVSVEWLAPMAWPEVTP